MENLLGIALNVLTPIALTAFSLLAGLRYGSRGALPLLGLLFVVIAILQGPLLGLAPVMGLIAVMQMERNQSYGRIVAMVSTPAVGLCLWQLVQALDRTYYQAQYSVMLAQFETLGVSVAEGGEDLPVLIEAVLRLQPAVGLLTLMLLFVLSYRASQWLAPRLGLEEALAPPLPLPLWRPWEELIWVLIVALGLGFLSDGFLADLALNMAFFMSCLYAVQGLAVLRFFARSRGVPPLVELTFYFGVLLITSFLALFISAGLGLLDTWFDWRRLRPVPTSEEEP